MFQNINLLLTKRFKFNKNNKWVFFLPQVLNVLPIIIFIVISTQFYNIKYLQPPTLTALIWILLLLLFALFHCSCWSKILPTELSIQIVLMEVNIGRVRTTTTSGRVNLICCGIVIFPATSPIDNPCRWPSSTSLPYSLTLSQCA